jgi:acetylornithine deacetylase/succinyl-diaminopimelate desuccinylase-like protein
LIAPAHLRRLIIMDTAAVQTFVERRWDESIVPTLMDYIRIPNKSPAFDPDWQAHGLIDQVVELFHKWALAHPLRGMKLDGVRLDGRTPLLKIDVPGQGDDCVLLYGHLDKQPEMTGWSEGLGPWQPVIRGDRLYGRGAADDGYSMFAALSALAALQEQGIAHARCVMLIEACEESGSYDLPPIIEHLGELIGNPSLVIALDSGCGNYDQLWCTTSLRGLVGGTLRIHVLTEGVHSGDAGGVVPCSFRIARMLLSRIENEQTGEILSPVFHCAIPPARQQQAAAAAAILGDSIHRKFPFAGQTAAVNADSKELILNRTWRPALSVIGAEGLPPAANAGNVLRPFTELKLRCQGGWRPTQITAGERSAVRSEGEFRAELGRERMGRA